MPNHRFAVSGFADEVGPDFDEQLAVFGSLGISRIDLRNVGETNVIDLTDEEVARAKTALDERGIDVASIGSPIGKIDVTEAFEPHFRQFERAIEVADAFDADRIRVFSYYIPEDDDPADHREEVLRRMEAKVERAEAARVTLLHENEKDIYGDTPARCRDLLTAIDSPRFRAVFDPANFLEISVEPYPDALLQLVEYVDQLHIKDAQFGERGAIEPAGEGDGRIPETIDALRRRGFDGPASLEPHLERAGPRSGYSGPEGFEIAAEALYECLESAGADYE